MNRRNHAGLRSAGVLVFLVVIALLGLCLAQIDAKAATASRTLKVKLNYTGAGPVDEKHKIHVLIFDADPATQTTFKATQSKTAGTKDETVTFSDLSFSPVYVLAYYDENGSSEMEPGTPVGIHGKEPGKLDPITIEEGKTVEVLLAFDDSTTVP